MGGAHPCLDGPERVLDRRSSEAHPSVATADTLLHLVDEVLVLPSGHAAFFAGRASALERAIPAGARPVAPHLQAAFVTSISISQLLTSRAAIDVGLGVVGEVGLHIEALLPVARGLGAGNRGDDARLVAGEDLAAAEVAFVGNSVQLGAAERALGGGGHRLQLVAVVPGICDVMGDDQVRLGIDRGLDIVAHQAAVLRARGHGPRVWIGQRDLSIWSILQIALHGLEPLDLLLDTRIAPAKIVDLLRPLVTLLLAVDPDHLVDVALDARLEMREPAGDLAFREVPVAIVDGLEFTAVDRDAVALQDAHPPAKVDEHDTGPLDRRAVVAPEVGDRLVVGNEAPGQPHHLDIPAGLAFETPARRDAVQISVDEEPQQDAGMIAGPPRSRGRGALEPEPGEVEIINEKIDDANRVIIVDPVPQPLGKQRRLTATNAFDEPRHACSCLFQKHTSQPSFHTASAASYFPIHADRRFHAALPYDGSDPVVSNVAGRLSDGYRCRVSVSLS